MARIEIEFNARKTFGSIQKKVNNFIENSGVLDEVSEFLIKSIRNRKNPVTGRNFKALRSSTIKWRERIAEQNSTHSKYSASTSNLTLTGAFIDSFKSKIVKSKKLIVIQPEGIHPGYTGHNRKNPSTNQKIAEGQKAGGRNVLGMSKKMKKEILEIVKQGFKREFNG